MLPEAYQFNHRAIRSYTEYVCRVDANTVEKEVSFHVALGPHTERHGDAVAVYEVPEGRIAWLSDWSFNGGFHPTQQVSIGGSLGRVTVDGQYVYVLNAAVYSGDMEVYSPARPIRFLAGEWIAVCFHHQGLPLDLVARATFRFTESYETKRFETHTVNWTAKSSDEAFDRDAVRRPLGG